METARDLVDQAFVSEVDVSDGFDMDQAHLVVVNGWRTLYTITFILICHLYAMQKLSNQLHRQHLP